MTTNEIKKEEKKDGLFLNIYFISFLFSISLFDFIRRLINYDYKIVNIVFLVFSLYLIIKIFLKRNKK